jgi:hypothetical protein
LTWVVLLGVMPLFTRLRQRSGDLLGGTAVVRLTSTELPSDEAVAESARHGAQRTYFTTKQLGTYGEHELETLADVLRRHDAGELERETLIIVARTIARKIGFSDEIARTAPLKFLRRFYREQRAALERRLLLGQRKATKFDRH